MRRSFPPMLRPPLWRHQRTCSRCSPSTSHSSTLPHTLVDLEITGWLLIHFLHFIQILASRICKKWSSFREQERRSVSRGLAREKSWPPLRISSNWEKPRPFWERQSIPTQVSSFHGQCVWAHSLSSTYLSLGEWSLLRPLQWTPFFGSLWTRRTTLPSTTVTEMRPHNTPRKMSWRVISVLVLRVLVSHYLSESNLNLEPRASQGLV